MSEEQIHCIQATAEDLPVLRAWMQSFYAEGGLRHGPATGAALDALLGAPGAGMAVIVWRGERPMGYFILTYGYSLERGGKVGLLDELFIVREARGQGAGRRAVAEAVRMAAEAGCRAVLMEVDEKNERAKRIYEGAGFEGLRREVFWRAIET